MKLGTFLLVCSKGGSLMVVFVEVCGGGVCLLDVVKLDGKLSIMLWYS